jgi:[acyl-carrier-protein] S-malonyltransferase
MTVAIVFPGQGAQSVGMLSGVFNSALYGDPAYAAYFESLQSHNLAHITAQLGFDLVEMIQTGSSQALSQTTITQPAMLLTGYATWCLLQAHWHRATQQSLQPSYFAGHSLGEFTAYAAAQSFSLVDAIGLVNCRARAMTVCAEKSVLPTGMAAVLNMSDEALDAACQSYMAEHPSQIVQAVNFNAPGQVVIAGHQVAIEAITPMLKAQGAKRVLPLPVSGAFHSQLMQPVQGVLINYLTTQMKVLPPIVPVVVNVNAQCITTVAAMQSLLAQQVCAPVQWVSVVETLQRQGVTHVIECGASVLTGLIKRIAPELITCAVTDDASAQAAVTVLQAAHIPDFNGKDDV